MAKRKINTTPDKSSSLLKRVHAFLPYILISAVAFNMWFVFSYVRRERVTVDGVQYRILNNVSNALHFVHSSLSNDISSARQSFSNEVIAFRSRALALSTPLFTDSVSSPVTSNVVLDVNSLPPVPVGDVPGYYFVCSGSPCLCIDGSYYRVGDDFGYGSIDRITKMFVVCGGRYYRLLSGSFRPLPSPAVPKLTNLELNPNG